MEDLKIIQVDNIDENEIVLWKEEGFFKRKNNKSLYMKPLTQVVCILFCVIGTVCLVFLFPIFKNIYLHFILMSLLSVLLLYVKLKSAPINITKKSYSYVITDKAVYSKIGSRKKKYQKFFFEDIDTIYTYTSDTSICIGRYKDCDEEDMELKNVKGFNTALTLLKEKTGIEPELVDM